MVLSHSLKLLDRTHNFMGNTNNRNAVSYFTNTGDYSLGGLGRGGGERQGGNFPEFFQEKYESDTTLNCE